MLGMSPGGATAKQSPMEKAVSCLSLVMAFAITFVFTPLIHGASVGWALDYMDHNYGAWMVWIGWYLWWVIVALLTFFISNLAIMMGIMLGQFLLLTMRSGRR